MPTGFALFVDLHLLGVMAAAKHGNNYIEILAIRGRPAKQALPASGLGLSGVSKMVQATMICHWHIIKDRTPCWRSPRKEHIHKLN
jgi:hypothetical protein